jgi:hypothetical protein
MSLGVHVFHPYICKRFVPVRFNAVITEFNLCDLVVRVSGYSHRVPGFDSQSYQIF